MSILAPEPNAWWGIRPLSKASHACTCIPGFLCSAPGGKKPCELGMDVPKFLIKQNKEPTK